MADDVLIEHDGDVAKVTLNMPDDGNKVSDPLAVRLTDTLNELAKDSRAIIFTGAGDDFCLGRSQMGRQGGDDSGPPEALDMRDNNEVVFNAYSAFRDTKIPIIGVVRGRALGPRRAGALNLPLETGLLVEQVESDSSADRAGIQGGNRRVYYGNIPLIIGGDVIVSLAGEPVNSTDDIRTILEDKRPGQEVTIVFFRDQDQVEMTFELVGRESDRTFRF